MEPSPSLQQTLPGEPGGPVGPRAAGVSMRGLILLLWCLWLLVAWMVTMSDRSPQEASRLMMQAVLVGLLVLWPVVRLSQDIVVGPPGWPPAPGLPSASESPPASGASDPLRRRRAMLGVLLDWLGLVLVLQAVIWPLQINAQWTVQQTIWLNAAAISWSLLAAALVALGVGTRGRGPRAVSMALCVALLWGEPAVMALVQTLVGGSARAAWRMRISPIETVWSLSVSQGLWSVHPWDGQVIGAALAAISAWGILFILSRRGCNDQVR